jgi:hypothetical protein
MDLKITWGNAEAIENMEVGEKAIRKLMKTNGLFFTRQ